MYPRLFTVKFLCLKGVFTFLNCSTVLLLHILVELTTTILIFHYRLSTLLENLRPSTDFGMLDRALGGPTHMMQSGISQARELNDPPELPGKTEFLLREWVNMYHSPAAGRDSTKAFTAFVQQVNVHVYICS